MEPAPLPPNVVGASSGPPLPAARKDRSSLRERLRFVLGLEDAPARIARGAAWGVFVAFDPLWGTQIALAVLGAMALRANRVAAVTFTFVSNPLTAAPMYLGAYALGARLLGVQNAGPPPEIGAFTPAMLAERAWEIAAPLLTGCALLGALFAGATYFAVLRLAALRRREAAPA